MAGCSLLVRLSRVSVAVVAGCAVAAGMGCTRKQAAFLTNTGDETIVAKAGQTHTKLEEAVVDEAAVNDYLGTVGRRIVEAARELDTQRYMRESDWKPGETDWMFGDDVHFHLVNNDQVNAVTTGGKHMYIYNGFLQQCRSEDELAAVMAHEFAHIYLQHIGKKVGGTQLRDTSAELLGFIVAEKVGDNDPMMKQATADATKDITKEIGSQWMMGYSRADEDKADEAGLAFYARAGYDPAKFGDVFQLALDKAGGKKEKLTDHPALADRVANAKKRAAALPPDSTAWRKKPVASLIKFRQIKEQAARAVADMPEGAEMAQAQEVLGAFSSCFTDEDDNREAEAKKKAAAQKQAAPQAQPRRNPLQDLFR